MKIASHSDILLVTATLVVIAVVAGIMVFRASDELQERHKTVFEPRVQANVQPDIQEVVIALPDTSVSSENYKNEIITLLVSYNNKTLNYFAAETAYKYNTDHLLGMDVPDGYQQFHLELVVKFQDLYNATQAVIGNKSFALGDLEEARENMDLFLARHSWIK